MSLAAIPLLVNIDYVLQLWLGNPPDYTAEFVTLTILTGLIFTMSTCVTKAIQATGRVKWFQIGVAVIMLCELPVAWVLLELDYPPYAAMWPSLLTYAVALLYRFILIHRYVEGYNYKEYMLQVVLRCLIVFSVSYTLCAVLRLTLPAGFAGFILSVVTCGLIVTAIICLFGLQRSELKVIKDKLQRKFIFC